MPAEVNIKVGSLRGTSEEEATTACSFLAKKSRKVARTWLTLVMELLAGNGGATSSHAPVRCPQRLPAAPKPCLAHPAERARPRARVTAAPGAAPYAGNG